MELIIKIDDEIYKKIKNDEFWLSCGLDFSMAYDLIKNGIPLKQIKGEIQNAYNDNKECDQEDVAYGLKIAMNIIEECR